MKINYDKKVIYFNFSYVKREHAGTVFQTPYGFGIPLSDTIHGQERPLIVSNRTMDGYSSKLYLGHDRIMEYAGSFFPYHKDGKKTIVEAPSDYVFFGKRGKQNGGKPSDQQEENTEPEPEPIPVSSAGIDSIEGKIQACYRADVPLMLYGPSGTGKTYRAIKALEAIGLEPLVISLNKETRLSFLAGFKNQAGDYSTTPFRDAIESGRPVIIDEADTNAEILLYLNSAISNKILVFPDRQIDVKSWFLLTANTDGSGGKDGYHRQALDVSTLKRLVVLRVDYDKDVEYGILPEFAGILHTIRENIDRHGIRNALVTTRDFVNIKNLLDIGFSLKQSIDMAIIQGKSADIAEKMLSGVSI